MAKNKALIQFLKDRRGKVGKTQKEISEALGMPGNTYGTHEYRGSLPEDPSKQEKLAQLLEVPLKELLDKVIAPKVDSDGNRSPNLAPLIQELAKTACSVVYLDDIKFLIEIQIKLEQPMSAVLIEELMKNRTGSRDNSR